MKIACESEASTTMRERSRGEVGEEEGLVGVAVAVGVGGRGAGWKTLSSWTGASRSWCKLSCCCSLLILRLLLRGVVTRAKAETRRGGSGERAIGRLEVVGVGVEGLDGCRSSSSPRASPPSPPSTPPLPLLPLPNFSFSFFLADDVNICFSIREGELRERCGEDVAPSGEAVASPSTTVPGIGFFSIAFFFSFFVSLAAATKTEIRISMLSGGCSA